MAILNSEDPIARCAAFRELINMLLFMSTSLLYNKKTFVTELYRLLNPQVTAETNSNYKKN